MNTRSLIRTLPGGRNQCSRISQSRIACEAGELLTPEQLKKWDAEVAKGKEFLGFAAA